jgi:hypothetical protein
MKSPKSIARAMLRQELRSDKPFAVELRGQFVPGHTHVHTAVDVRQMLVNAHIKLRGELSAFTCMQMPPTRTRTAVCHVEAVETSGSVHRYISGPLLWDTELMLCSTSFA